MWVGVNLNKAGAVWTYKLRVIGVGWKNISKKFLSHWRKVIFPAGPLGSDEREAFGAVNYEVF